jgi:ferritin-like protein
VSDSSQSLHEARETLSPEILDRHRAIVSLMEELEAADWYDQRYEASRDAELRAILAHNRDEEKEHAAMVLEWLRRRDPALDKHLRAYLFQEGDIAALEEALGAESPAAEPPGADGSLGIGDMRREGDAVFTS